MKGKKICAIVISMLIICCNATAINAENVNDIAVKKVGAVNVEKSYDTLVDGQDQVVLSVGIGTDKGQLNYSDSMVGGGDGPEAFTVTIDKTIYIVDNVNKRVNVYKDGSFEYDIDVPYITYVRSIVVSKNMIYLMDYDTGTIYVINSAGKILKKVFIDQGMNYYLMRKLYVQDDGSVWLSYENKIDGEGERGIECSYSIEDLAEGNANYIEGYVKDGVNTYSIPIIGSNLALIKEAKVKDGTNNSVSTFRVSSNEMLANAKILDVDADDNLFVDVFETVNASKVIGEYTVRKYSDGECVGITDVDLDRYYYMPNNVLNVSEDGNLYQLVCGVDEVQILKKGFVQPLNFTSNINKIKDQVLKEQLKTELCDAYATTYVNAPNDETSTLQNAMNCCLLTWNYKAANAKNPNASNISTPDYLKNVSKPSEQTGIPYCWGGFDGISTSSSSSWSNFKDAMSKGKFAGNVKTSTSGYQSGTAGLDCSGFVSSVAGFSHKLSTSDLASNTYTKSISVSNRKIYDIYVKSGTHVVYYVGETNDGISTREATTTGDDKTKLYSRSTSWLSGYSLRRFRGW